MDAAQAAIFLSVNIMQADFMAGCVRSRKTRRSCIGLPTRKTIPPTNPALPSRRNYKQAEVISQDLPFIQKGDRFKVAINNWQKPIDDYSLACEIGEEYAAHFVQYLKGNPDEVGTNLLGRIVSDIDFQDDSCAKGYWIGFFSYLELLLYKRGKKRNVFRDLDKHRAKYPQEA